MHRLTGLAIAVLAAGIAVAVLFSIQEPARRQVAIADPWPREGVLVVDGRAQVLLPRDHVEVVGRADGRILLILRSRRIRSYLGPEIHAWTTDTAPARIALGIDPRPPSPPPRRKPGSATMAVER
jgi:hypothetical protein